MSQLCAGSFYKKHIGKRKVDSTSGDLEPTNKQKSKRQITSSASTSQQVPSATSNKVNTADNNASTGPRVEIINGRIVVKESSLLLNNASTAVEDDYEEVVEGVHATATYSSFLKRRPSPSWGLEETRLFYTALRQCGLEFTMMQAFFPGRTRLQLKRKFMREEQSHPDLIKLALETTLPLDLSPFEATLGSSLLGVVNAHQQPESDTDKVGMSGEPMVDCAVVSSSNATNAEDIIEV